MRFLSCVCLLALYLPLAACSTDEETSARTGDHVWKAQENAYRKAQTVDSMIQQGAERQRRAMEEQGG